MKLRITVHATLNKMCRGFFLLDQSQAGKACRFYESASTQRNASRCNHLIRIRKEDKIKCLWLCVRCKERNPSTEPFVTETEPAVQDILGYFQLTRFTYSSGDIYKELSRLFCKTQWLWHHPCSGTDFLNKLIDATVTAQYLSCRKIKSIKSTVLWYCVF